MKHLFNTLDFRLDGSLAKTGEQFETLMANNATFCNILLLMAIPYPRYTSKDVIQCLNDFGAAVVSGTVHDYDIELAACLLLLEQFDDNKEEVKTWCACVAHYIPLTYISADVAVRVYGRIITPKITFTKRRLRLDEDGD